ncbi:nucleoside-diphosphate kinase [Candidatus Uhrbacteria bacterium]|nr:nucleoside-diphosphate kinase [Candidatus Uhrbacteria bacterium]
MQRTCVLMKPDTLQRNLLGEIVGRFERKGLKIVGCKMMQISDLKVLEHYTHHADKPFFAGLKRFMQSAPIVAMVLEGVDAVDAVRTIVGPTKGRTAPAGTIRGDLAMSMQANLLHASDSLDAAEQEIWRFFNTDEIFSYDKMDTAWVYAEDERK